MPWWPRLRWTHCTCSGRGQITRARILLPVCRRVFIRLSAHRQDSRRAWCSASQTVEVNAEPLAGLQTETASVSSRAANAGTKAIEKPLFTPRLRKYFPETLVWRPEVITDKHGHAHINFPMADNITAWKMSVLASNEAGEVGIAEKELRSF